MKRKIIVVGAIALLFCSNFTLKAQAQSETAPCKNIASCVVTGTAVIGGILYYVIKNTATGVVRRVPVKQVPPSHSNEQYEEKLVTTTIGGKTCEELAEDETRKTGKKWYKKSSRIIPFTGPLWQPKSKVQVECTITTDPDALKKAEGRRQKAEGISQKGIQTPPDLEPLNRSSVGVLNPCSLRSLLWFGQKRERINPFCLLPSAFCLS